MARLQNATDLPVSSQVEDAGLARQVIQLALMDPDGLPTALYVVELKSWMVWDGQRWAPDPTAAAYFDACRKAASMFCHAAKKMELQALEAPEPDRERLNALAKMRYRQAKRLLSYAGASASEKFARTEKPVCITLASGSPFDLQDFAINCRSGIYDAKSQTIYPHTANAMFTRCMPQEYTYLGCDTFWEMLEAIMPDRDTRKQLLWWMGSCLLGYSPQHLAIWYGRGADGKGTLQRILCAVMGEYAAALPEGALTVNHKQEHPTELSCLEGARFVYADESSEGARLNEARVKQLTGGGVVPVRGMRQDFRPARPTWSLTLLTNHLPNVRGYENAIARRLLFFPFQTRFWLPSDSDFAQRPAGSQVGNPAREAYVIENELAGVFRLLCMNATEFIEFGCTFQPSALMIAAGQDHRADNDAMGQFFSQVCEYPAPGHSLPIRAVVEKLKEFCAESQMLCPSQQAINRWLHERGVDRASGRAGASVCKVYRGIRWKYEQANEYATA